MSTKERNRIELGAISSFLLSERIESAVYWTKLIEKWFLLLPFFLKKLKEALKRKSLDSHDMGQALPVPVHPSEGLYIKNTIDCTGQ